MRTAHAPTGGQTGGWVAEYRWLGTGQAVLETGVLRRWQGAGVIAVRIRVRVRLPLSMPVLTRNDKSSYVISLFIQSTTSSFVRGPDGRRGARLLGSRGASLSL